MHEKCYVTKLYRFCKPFFLTVVIYSNRKEVISLVIPTKLLRKYNFNFVQNIQLHVHVGNCHKLHLYK